MRCGPRSPQREGQRTQEPKPRTCRLSATWSLFKTPSTPTGRTSSSRQPWATPSETSRVVCPTPSPDSTVSGRCLATEDCGVTTVVGESRVPCVCATSSLWSSTTSGGTAAGHSDTETRGTTTDGRSSITLTRRTGLGPAGTSTPSSTTCTSHRPPSSTGRVGGRACEVTGPET